MTYKVSALQIYDNCNGDFIEKVKVNEEIEGEAELEAYREKVKQEHPKDEVSVFFIYKIINN